MTNEKYGILTANQASSGQLPEGTKLYLIDSKTDSLNPVIEVSRKRSKITAKIKQANDKIKTVVLDKQAWIVISYQDLTGKKWSEIQNQTRGATSLRGLRGKTSKVSNKASCLSHLYLG